MHERISTAPGLICLMLASGEHAILRSKHGGETMLSHWRVRGHKSGGASQEYGRPTGTNNVGGLASMFIARPTSFVVLSSYA